MIRKRTIFSVVAGALFLAASAAAQQGSSGFSLGVGGGFARSNNLGLGYELTSTLELPSPVSGLRPRLDLLLADFDRGPNLVALSANALVTPFSNPRVAPYLLADPWAEFQSASSQGVVTGPTSRNRILWKPIGITIQF